MRSNKVSGAITEAAKELRRFGSDRIVLHTPWELGYIKMSVTACGMDRERSRTPIGAPIGELLGGLSFGRS